MIDRQDLLCLPHHQLNHRFPRKLRFHIQDKLEIGTIKRKEKVYWNGKMGKQRMSDTSFESMIHFDRTESIESSEMQTESYWLVERRMMDGHKQTYIFKGNVIEIT